MGHIFGEVKYGDPKTGFQYLEKAALRGHTDAVDAVQEMCDEWLESYIYRRWANNSVAGAAYSLGYLHAVWQPTISPMAQFQVEVIDESGYGVWETEQGVSQLVRASNAGHQRAANLLSEHPEWTD